MDAAEPSPWGKVRRGRGRQYDVKREAVLTAATMLMRRRGYGGMALAELAELLNITKPTLYHYVGGKEALFAEIVARSQQMTLDMMREVVAQPASGGEKLRRIMVAYMEIVNSDAGTGLIFSNTAEIGAATQAQIKARAGQADALILQVLREGVADGSLRVADPGLVLRTLFGSLNWTPNWFKPGGRLSLREAAERQVDILLGGVRAAP